MNLADSSALMTTLIAALCAGAGAAGSGAPWWGIVLFGLLGLVVGVGCAMVFQKAAYHCLAKEGWFAAASYMTLPIIAFGAVGVLCAAGAEWLCSFLWIVPPA